MQEQPVPRDDQWPWSVPLWRFRLSGAIRPISVHVVEGVHETCSQRGQTICADKIACVITLKRGLRSQRMHFHSACYVAWERMERSPPAVQPDNVVPLPERHGCARHYRAEACGGVAEVSGEDCKPGKTAAAGAQPGGV
jgi:hypothetical protein